MRRGQWWSAGIWAGLASGTRQAGVLLAIAFVVEYLRQREWKPSRVRWDAAAVAHRADRPRLLHGVQLALLRGSVEVRTHTVLLGPGGEPALVGHGPHHPHHRRGCGGWNVFNSIVVRNVIDLVAMLATVVLLVLALVGPWRLGQQAWYLVAGAAANLSDRPHAPVWR